MLQSAPYLLTGLATLLGLLVGSFLNVVIYRLPLMMEREWRQQCAALLQSDAGTGGSAPLPAAADGRALRPRPAPLRLSGLQDPDQGPA